MSAKLSLSELKAKGRAQKAFLKGCSEAFALPDFFAEANDSKNLVRKCTGIVYDDAFLKHYCTWDPNYPETPRRLVGIIERINEYGLVQKCRRIPATAASLEDLLKKHPAEHAEQLKQACSLSEEDMEAFSSRYDAVYVNASTFETAVLSAGSCIALTKEVAAASVQNGIALVRPPGHHAMQKTYCGYCFFNNAALSAQYALDHCGLKRVLIVDWDVHHGQATQQMFYDDDRVLYFSIHRYEHGEFWPNLRESNFDSIGSGKGKGFNVNVPLNETGMEDIDYLTIFHRLLLPLAYEFAPELVIISAGYDSAFGDEKGEMKVTPACYAYMTNSLMGLAKGKVVVLLEGGYFVPSLADSCALTLRTLIGEAVPAVDVSEQTLKQSLVNTVYDVCCVLKEHWRCFAALDQFPAKNQVAAHRPIIAYRGVPPEAPFLTRNCYPRPKTNAVAEFDLIRSRIRLTEAKFGVGFVSDDRMLLHLSEEPNCPETPNRLVAIMSKLKEFGLLHRFHVVSSRKATQAEIEQVHAGGYWEELQDVCASGEVNTKWKSVYFNIDSLEAARLSAGCLLEAVDAVLQGRCATALAAIRPPGHHAEKDAACGFCIFNNVAVAAVQALRNGAKRVLVLDWDIHHGNGTQHMFYDRSDVLYVSIHRYDNGNFFPNSPDAEYTNVGTGAGLGFNVNIPFNQDAMGDDEYMLAFLAIVLPIATQFQPDLVLVSGGFDAMVGDSLGGYKVSPQLFGHMLQLLRCLAGGRLVLALEGGYTPSSVSLGFTMCGKALLGDPLPPAAYRGQISASAIATVNLVRLELSKHWSILGPIRRLRETVSAMEISLAAGPSSSAGLSDASGTPDASFLGGCLQGFRVFPLKGCPHVELVSPLPDAGIDTGAACETCLSRAENWTCLTCYHVGCARAVSGHMEQHAQTAAHPVVLSFSDLSVWCYSCESYLDCPALFDAQNAAHEHKFGERMVWKYDT